MDSLNGACAVKFPEVLLQFCHQLEKYAGGGVGRVAGLDSSPWQYTDIFCSCVCNFVNLYLNSLLMLLLHTQEKNHNRNKSGKSFVE